MSIFTLTISCLTTSNLPWFMDLTFHIPMLFTASDFTSITSHIHNWVLFMLWLHLFYFFLDLFPPLFSSSILGTYRPGDFIFQCHIFFPFHTVHGVPKHEYWSGLLFPSPIDHILSELPTMTCLGFALYGMLYIFIDLDKAVIHVIILVSFLWMWFLFSLPSMNKDKRLMEAS